MTTKTEVYRVGFGTIWARAATAQDAEAAIRAEAARTGQDPHFNVVPCEHYTDTYRQDWEEPEDMGDDFDHAYDPWSASAEEGHWPNLNNPDYLGFRTDD